MDGTWIDPKLLIAGRKEEMKYMMKMEVFEVVDEKECYVNGCRSLKLKWVDMMKGKKCRSRLVCREIKRSKDRDEQLGPEDVFSPMPPSEGTMMTGNDDGNHAGGPFEMATWDVSRAHVNVEARRWIYPHLPEGHELKGKLARLCRSMYGTQNEASIWRDTWSEVLKDGSPLSFAVMTEISKDCVMVTTSVQWDDGSSCKSLGKSSRDGLR